MNNKMLFRLTLCAALCVAAVPGLRAQNGPRGGFGFAAAAPAPVPPEVAMPRPTQAEIDKINADIQGFIAASPDKDLLLKWQSLLTVQMPRPNSAIAPVQTGVRTTTRHNRFVETARTNDFDILFEGDSITDWWQQGGTQGGSDVQKKYFGDVKVANFAVAGDTTQGVLWGLQNGEGQGHKPKAVMLMIGTNNTGGNSGPEIAEGVGAIIYELRKDFPDAKILLLAIFPRGAGPADPLRVKNEEANKIIARLDDGKHVFFRNINDKFLNADGSLIGFRRDNLHPTAEGYELWAAAVADILKSWAN
jgi:lysophospholipase L1-like esterase